MCKVPVLKSAGCNHMTCPVCKYQWCWLCGAEYTSIHFNPLNIAGCPMLQSGNRDSKTFNPCVLCCYKLCYILLMVCIVSPLVLLFGAPVMFYVLLEDQFRYWRRLRREKCCRWLLFVILTFPSLMLVNVFIVWPVVALGILPFLIFQLSRYCKEKQRNRNEVKRNLQKKIKEKNKNL